MFRSISRWILDGTTTNYHKPWHGPLQMMIWIITNHYKSPQVYHDINHYKSQITTNHHKPWYGPLQMMIWIITNHYKSPQVYRDINHYKSQITTNHHKPWYKPPWTMTETSTKHDMNHYKSPQTMTWTIMMTQKELCIKPYGFLVMNDTI